MILHLNALQLNVSHFGRKYLHNNGVNEMAGSRTNPRVMAYGPTNILKMEVINDVVVQGTRVLD